MENKLPKCDGCGRTSELIRGLCSFCHEHYHPEEYNNMKDKEKDKTRLIEDKKE